MSRLLRTLVVLTAVLTFSGCADILGLDRAVQLHLRGPAAFDGASAEADPTWDLPEGFRCDYPLTFWIEDGSWDADGRDIQWLRARLRITSDGQPTYQATLYGAEDLERLLGTSPPRGESRMRTREFPVVADRPFSFSLIIEYYDRTVNEEARAQLKGPGGQAEIVCRGPDA